MTSLEIEKRLIEFQDKFGDQFDSIYVKQNDVFGVKHYTNLVESDIAYFPNLPEPNPGDRTTHLGYLEE